MIRILQLIFMGAFFVVLIAQCHKSSSLSPAKTLTKEQLGKVIFFDNSLSNPGGQSCATCHSPLAGFSDPAHSIVSAGAADKMFANRNAPSVSYAMYAPPLHYNKEDETYVGGLFWDGRVNSLKDQAKKPFFNPLEMNITDLEMFAKKVKASVFYTQLVQLYGETGDNEKLLDNIADAIEAYERSVEINSFSSKFDYYLKGQASFTPLEKTGFELFQNKAQCANCHPVEPDPVYHQVLLTDFTYDNIGVPKNTYNPYYYIPSKQNPDGSLYVDPGLYSTTKNKDNLGQFKVPTLRNIALTGPYFHNGVYGTLEEVIHFYNKRDTDPAIPSPEINSNVNHEELGNLKLTPQEEQALVAFLKTLTDGWKK